MTRLPSADPTFWPIAGRDWRRRTAHSQGLSISAQHGLRLAARPNGPLALDWPDGSLGGLALPLGMALDEERRLYLLDLQHPWRIRRYEPATERFRPLPGLGGPGRDPRQFRQPRNIALLRHNLYVADGGNRRLQVFDRRTLALRHLWGAAYGAPRDVAAGPRRAGPQHAWLLMDDGRVYRHRPGADVPTLAFTLPGPAQRWQRLLVDREGRVYVLRLDLEERPELHIFDAGGEALDVVSDAGDVRGRFAPPPLRLFFNRRGAQQPRPQEGYFCLPNELAHDCDPQQPASPPAPEQPLALCLPGGRPAGGQIFDRRGCPVELDPAELVQAPIYGRDGVWISKALDSDRYRCQWHRVALALDPLPPGARLRILTLSADAATEQPAEDDPRWVQGLDLAGRLQKPGAPAEQADDFLVQSHPGQFLWLMVICESDGFGTPALKKLEVHFPRQSYLDYLPAIFSEEDESRWFMERFLSIFQTEWDALEQKIASLPALFDADAVPGGPFLQQLARWIDLPLEGAWDAEQQRVLLQQVKHFYRQRGTAAGLRHFLQAYMANLTGLGVEQLGDFPVLVEGFRRRNHTFLAASGASGAAPTAHALWSPSLVNRLQSDTHARAGEARLVSTEDPDHDAFRQYAHRFQVYLPAGWVRSAEDESMVRRALDAEKPAHTAYDLCLVPTRFRVGVQSTVGLDTVVGGIPTARLACSGAMEAAAPSRPASHRLGYDTVLSGTTENAARLPFTATRL